MTTTPARSLALCVGSLVGSSSSSSSSSYRVSCSQRQWLVCLRAHARTRTPRVLMRCCSLARSLTWQAAEEIVWSRPSFHPEYTAAIRFHIRRVVDILQLMDRAMQAAAKKPALAVLAAAATAAAAAGKGDDGSGVLIAFLRSKQNSLWAVRRRVAAVLAAAVEGQTRVLDDASREGTRLRKQSSISRRAHRMRAAVRANERSLLVSKAFVVDLMRQAADAQQQKLKQQEQRQRKQLRRQLLQQQQQQQQMTTAAGSGGGSSGAADDGGGAKAAAESADAATAAVAVAAVAADTAGASVLFSAAVDEEQEEEEGEEEEEEEAAVPVLPSALQMVPIQCFSVAIYKYVEALRVLEDATEKAHMHLSRKPRFAKRLHGPPCAADDEEDGGDDNDDGARRRRRHHHHQAGDASAHGKEG